MKKLIVFVLAFILLASSAIANVQFVEQNENFTIRGGIHFRSSKEAIEAIEKTNGNSINEADTYYQDGYDLSYSTLLAGYEADITYWVDEENTLDEFQYILYQNEAYENVKTALIQKYGAPLFSEQSYIAGTGIDKISKSLSILGPTDRDYAGWIVKYNDCYLMLEMKQVYFSKAKGITLYLVNYDLLSNDEMQLHQKAYDGLIDYMNSSFENDL